MNVLYYSVYYNVQIIMYKCTVLYNVNECTVL